jgi:inosine-uridine nucleoside N-ribohydrolase
MSNRLKIILDTDPGGDDIFALLWILSLVKQGFMELVAVTTAQGNVNANVTFTCASQVLGLTGFEQIEIGKGVIFTAAEIEDAAYIHGVDGMGGLAATLPAGKHEYTTAPTSDDLIIEKLNAEPGEITLIAIAQQPKPNLLVSLKRLKKLLLWVVHFKYREMSHPMLNLILLLMLKLQRLSSIVVMILSYSLWILLIN